MKLTWNNIIGKHENQPCVVACHGPSLNKDKEKISSLQREKGLIRFSVNEWYDFFDIKPDYWVVSNSEFNIKDSIIGGGIWRDTKYPLNLFNEQNIPLLYNATADLTSVEFIEQNLHCDYFPYDSKHFKNHDCGQIIANFRAHYEKHKDLNFKYYGNNSQMWQPTDISNVNPYCAATHKGIAAAWSGGGRCCSSRINDLTIQEKVQEICEHGQHLGPGQTVGMVCIMFAILMKCNPIYVSGLDLDYSLGYAESEVQHYINAGNLGHWRHCFRDFLTDDMRILKESAENIGVEILNLNNQSWHNVFKTSELFV